MQDFFLIICGPTGVGKSELSIKLAEKLPIEIINCDVGQFYTPVAIGTAKPDWQHEIVRHHLFDQFDKSGSFSVTEYRARLIPLMQEIRSRGALPVLVGGSLFYIKSLFFPPLQQSSEHTSEQQEQEEWTATQRKALPEALWEQLQAIDPVRAQAIGKHDPYRLARAIAIWEASGQLPSEQVPVFKPFGNFHLTFVTRERSELYERINERVGQMFNEGWVEEVDRLSPDWRTFLQEKKLIGYPEIITCLETGSVATCKTNPQLIQRIQKKTRNYAKRQQTFWRTFNKQLSSAVVEYTATHSPLDGSCQELNLTLSSVDLYLNHIVDLVHKKRVMDRHV